MFVVVAVVVQVLLVCVGWGAAVETSC